MKYSNNVRLQREYNEGEKPNQGNLTFYQRKKR